MAQFLHLLIEQALFPHPQESIVALSDESNINDAIRACIEHCRGKLPRQLVPAIKKFLEELSVGGKWKPEELRTIEDGVRKYLIFGVLDGAIYAGDATNQPAGSLSPSASKSPKPSPV